MPESTEFFGLTYPCNTDPINPAAFGVLASQIDGALTVLQTNEDFATGRYASVANGGAQAAIAPTVETALTNPGAIYTVLADGIYQASMVFQISGTTTLDSLRLRVRRNVTPLFGRSINNNGGGTSHPWCNLTGLVSAVAGDTINATVLWFGTGTATVDLLVQIRQVVRVL